jgi:hypothetical protein
MNRTNVIEDLNLLPLPPWWLDPWAIATGVLLLLAAGTGFYLLARALRRQAPAVVAAPSGPPPHDEFLRRLAELRARRDALAAYPLGIEVSEILRGYIDARFRFPVLFQTTREFLAHVAGRTELDAVQRDGLARFLGRCDDVKFARGEASDAERDALLDAAESFIRGCAGLVPAPKP